ncbi:MAG: hypothetical protein H7259_00740 [Cytophagales bacterium]|nr:hypothetical protein [Cytophaga sp.]
MKKINKTIFIISTIVFALLLIPAFIAAFAEDEGTLPANGCWIIFARLFSVLRFPTHTMVWSAIIDGGSPVYFIGLMINCVFYGLITERIFSFFLKLKSRLKNTINC